MNTAGLRAIVTRNRVKRSDTRMTRITKARTEINNNRKQFLHKTLKFLFTTHARFQPFLMSFL